MLKFPRCIVEFKEMCLKKDQWYPSSYSGIKIIILSLDLSPKIRILKEHLDASFKQRYFKQVQIEIKSVDILTTLTFDKNTTYIFESFLPQCNNLSQEHFDAFNITDQTQGRFLVVSPNTENKYFDLEYG